MYTTYEKSPDFWNVEGLLERGKVERQRIRG